MPKLSTIRDRLIERCGVELTPRFLLDGEQRTFFLEAGTGFPVVLLHGAGGGGILWTPVIGDLCRRHRVIAPDVIGFGESAKPRADYSKNFFSNWLGRFLDALQLQHACLIGHSLGGVAALQFSLDCPERVNRLVLVGSGGLGVQRLPLSVMATLVWAHLCPNRRSVGRLTSHLFHGSNAAPDELETEYMVTVLRSPGGRRVFTHGRGKLLKPFAPEVLQSLTMPVLLIWGARDRIAPVQMGAYGARMIPKAGLAVIDNAGHAPFFETPQAFNDALLPFLSASTTDG